MYVFECTKAIMGIHISYANYADHTANIAIYPDLNDPLSQIGIKFSFGMAFIIPKDPTDTDYNYITRSELFVKLHILDKNDACIRNFITQISRATEV